MSLLIVLVFLGIAVLGMPLAFSLGIGAVAGLIYSDVDFNLLPSRMMNAVNAFPLMSIPFFVLAGEIMMKAGIMQRLIDLANAAVGQVKGGLAHVAMGAGLGLSITKAFVEGYGGSVKVVSEHEQGSCFTLQLPDADLGPGPDDGAEPNHLTPREH